MNRYMIIGAILLSLSPAYSATQTKLSTALPKTSTKASGPTASYRFMNMNLKGDLVQTVRGMAPESLSVFTHNVGLKVPINEILSVNVGTTHITNKIRLVGYGQVIDAKTQGLSDTQVGLGIQKQLKGKSQLSANLGVSLPTGSYKEEFQGRLVHYPGQLGSGTYDLTQNISYKSRWKNLTYNGMLLSKIHTGKNDFKYRLGNYVTANVSASYWFIKYLSLTTRAYYKGWGKVAGGTPGDIFAARGSRWSANLGLSSGIYLGKKFAAFIEAGSPFYSDQTGPLKGLHSQWYMNSFVQSTF